MSTDGGAIPSVSIFSDSAPESPRNRIKFLCCHGGRILPRPPDGQLKYVGGETRVISVTKGISFHELMKKLTYLTDGDMTLKYQAAFEDLDALVSVKSDEAVSYMCDEIERYENSGSSRLRAFLFPTNTITMENRTDPPPDQLYIDAVNGISTGTPPKPHPAVNLMQQSSLVSSDCSPPSPDSCIADAVTRNEPVVLPSNTCCHNGRVIGMHKVHSSPNICGSTISHHFIHQSPPQTQQYVHHYPPGPGNQSSTNPSIDLPRSERRLISVRSVGCADGVRYQMDPITQAPASHHYYTSKQNRGGNACWYYDDCSLFPGRRMAERTSIHALSPIHPRVRFEPCHADNI